MAPGTPAGVREDQPRVTPAAHQPEQGRHLFHLDAARTLGQPAVALDLGGHGLAHPEALDGQLLVEFIEPVLDRLVQMLNGLEDRERDHGVNGGEIGGHGNWDENVALPLPLRSGLPSSHPTHPMPETAEAKRTAFEREALPHLDTVYRVALRFTGEPARAQDLVQDTMLKAFRSWHRYQPGTNVRAWLLTILRNTFINEYRKEK